MSDVEEKKRINWVGLILILAVLAGIWSFHPKTRFKLAGDWKCQQSNNGVGVMTTETYGFFGTRESVNSTPQGQLHFTGSYSISGDVITNKPEYAEANGRRMPVKLNDGSEAEFYEAIGKLTSSQMSLTVTTNLNPKTVMYNCQKL
ncbi:hypothetical protein [Herbaspirillum lusitanum]|uniref:hypothetical protein n=1 Tax=Herbaspirillum lusitanum TaxID=213312 RepID=UPI00058C90AC|nr:hypothetical protein [Herbaspirillum lusitanum]